MDIKQIKGQRGRKKALEADGAKPIDMDDRVPAWIENPEYVTDHELARHKELTGMTIRMNRLYPDGWGDDEVRKEIVNSRKRRIEATLIKYRNLDTERRNQDEAVQNKIQEYLGAFRDPTPNDMVMLTELARIGLTMDIVNERMQGIILDKDSQLKPSDFESITKIRKDSMASFQAIEKALGIDRGSREKESDAYNIIQDKRAEAAALLKKRKRDITCPRCRAEEDKVINLGFVVFHFDLNDIPWSFTAMCPSCKKEFSLSSGKAIIQHETARQD